MRPASASGTTGTSRTVPKPSTVRSNTARRWAGEAARGSVVISLLGQPVPVGQHGDQLAAEPERELITLMGVPGHARRPERDHPPAVLPPGEVPHVPGDGPARAGVGDPGDARRAEHALVVAGDAGPVA